MSAEEGGILDPAHEDDGGVTHAGVAGLPTPDVKDDTKPEVVVSEDGNIVKQGDKTYVRQEALHQARQEAQRYREQVDSIAPLMPEFNAYLQQREARQQATVERSQRQTSQNDYTQDELEGLAITRGYYKEDGSTPDVNRAARELDIITGVSQRQVNRAVRPVHESTIRSRAQSNREKAAGAKFVDGQPIAEQKYLDAAFNALGDEHVADPNTFGVAQLVAVGLQTLDARKNGTYGRTGGRGRGGREPMLVEGSSGAQFGRGDGELTGLELAAARARGKSPEQWAKMSKSVNKNTDTLEDA